MGRLGGGDEATPGPRRDPKYSPHQPAYQSRIADRYLAARCRANRASPDGSCGVPVGSMEAMGRTAYYKRIERLGFRGDGGASRSAFGERSFQIAEIA